MPKLRFKADDGSEFPEWEEICFGDVFDEIIIRTSDTNKYSLYSLTIENGVTPKTERYERGYLVKKEDNSYKVVPPNAFVYNPMNLRFGALAVNHECFPVAVSGYYNVFCLKNNNVLIFWENYLVSKKMLDYYFSIATGSLIEKLRVHYSNFIKIKRKLPTLPEQRKIASFLSTIDEIIAKSRAEVEAWEKRKKGVIKKLFSQEVRFKADDGSEFPEWKEKKIRDILTIYHGKDYKNLQKGIFPVLGTGGEITRVNQFLCDWPCVVIGRKGTINKPMFIDEPFWSVDTLFYTKNKEGFLPKWEYYLFQNIDWTRYNEASGVPSLNASTINNIKILSPTLPEQQKIADCLSSIDEVIKKCKKELAAWEELKKGLLQQMFI